MPAVCAADQLESQIFPDAPRGRVVTWSSAADRRRRRRTGPGARQRPREKLYQAGHSVEGQLHCGEIAMSIKLG